MIYICAHDPTANAGRGGERRRSLEIRDRDEAKRIADEQAAKLRRGIDSVTTARPTVGRVFALYLAHRTPDKGRSSQVVDKRESEMWKAVLGSGFDLSKLSRREWDGFIRCRRSGEIDGHGRTVLNSEERRAVRDRAVEKSLVFLRAVCRWATDFRDNSGRLLLERDPTRGFEIPDEKNPKRPVATHDRVDAIRKHYRKIRMRIERGAKRETVDSYLPEVFEIVVGTGRRIGAVCGLRSEDVELERTERTPWGAIVFPEDTDKMGKRWRCPIGPRVREAIDSALLKRRHVGPGPLFPSPKDPRQPVSIYQMSKWLREAEKLAELKPMDGSLWHAYRRLWASARKDLPDVDVAQAGGWKSLEALKSAYQQPDDATMLRVVTHEAELREVK
jgi:integrase